MGFLLSLTRTVATQVSRSALAAIERIDHFTTSPRKNETSTGPKTESDPALIHELFGPVGLAGIHDQADASNQQQAILVGRFYDHLAAQQLPDELVADLVQMKFNKMLFDQMGIPEVDYSDEEGDY